MWERFRIETPGKWVLAGEHAVLRGPTAIALPLPERKLTLSFEPDNSGELKIRPDAAVSVLRDILRSIEDRWQSEDRSFRWPSGTLTLESTIPVGAGLGSSAALSVAVTRWVAGPLGIPESEWPEFARALEHRFHGQSSGMDVSVILAGKPVTFVKGRGASPLAIRKTPRFTFHDTDTRARTMECILRVEELREEDPALAMKIDEQMSGASRLALEGLVAFDSGLTDRGLDLIARAMNQARECFYSWRLVPHEAELLEQELLKRGALAAKLTGAGGGGMMVALWRG